MQKSRVLTVPFFLSFFKTQKVILGLAQITGVQQRSVLPAVSREGGSVAVAAVAIEETPPSCAKKREKCVSGPAPITSYHPGAAAGHFAGCV